MKLDELEFFHEVTLRVSGTLDIGEAMLKLFAYLRRFIPADRIGLHRFDIARRMIYGVAEADDQGLIRGSESELRVFPMDADFLAILDRSRGRGPIVTIHNTPDSLPDAVLRGFPHLRSRSVLALRLWIQDEVVGGLALSAEGHGRYKPRHAALLEQVKEPIALAMSNAWRYRELERLRDRLIEDNRALSQEIQHAAGVEVVGADFGLATVMELVRRVAPLSSPVLLLGETGTGKEVIANAIHQLSPRSAGPLVRVQCGAIPETLLDSELFGHEKGAFTGAIERKRGRFERAAGGTIFLDEIGELSPEAQVKLLRVLQEKQFERVGGTETLEADVRVIAATHRDLARRVREGRFREDLWYRLNVFPIFLPPLRMRREDIPALAEYFVRRKAREMNLERMPELDPADLRRLQSYDWPGNVRELQNVVERALILSRGSSLVFPPLGIASSTPAPATASADAAGDLLPLEEAMAAHIRRALSLTGGRVSGPRGAAARLHINPSTLRSKMKKLGVRVRKSAEA